MFLSTYRGGGTDWGSRVDQIDPLQHPAALAREVVARARDYDAVILRGAMGSDWRYVDQLVAAVVARRGTPVVLGECIWEQTSRRISRAGPPTMVDRAPEGSGRLARTAIRALDTAHTHYCVLSTGEARQFPAGWGIPAERVHPTLFGATASDEGPLGPGPGGVFAAGNSLRDYRAMAAVAPQVRAPVRIASRLLPTAEGPNLVTGELTPQRFRQAAREATVVVVPVLAGAIRSAGQETYLNAMLRAKPVVVTDTLGVRDHIEHGVDGFVVPPDDSDALLETLNALLADPARMRAVGEAARRRVLREFTSEQFFGRMLAVADLAAQRR